MLRYSAWPYQQAALVAITRARKQAKTRALVVMAPGLGKTVLSALDVKRFLEANGGRVLYLCHQNDILTQARETYESILGLGYSYANFNGYEKDFHEADLVFASFQSMRSWRIGFFPNEFAYVVADESHHSEAPTYRPTLDYFQPKFMLGITATPDRADLKDIRRIYGPEVFNLSIEDALAGGLLTKVDYRLITDEIQNASSFNTSIGKVSVSALNRAIFVRKRDEEIVRLIEDKIAGIKNPRILIFGPSIAYCEHFAKLMPKATPIHSDINPRKQRSRLKAFRAGKINTLITVDKFNEGIDLPDANVIVFLRSTSSRTIFLQQLGRGLRLSPGKDQVLVLDFVGNCERLEMIQDLWKKVAAAYEELGLESDVPISVKVGSVHFDELALNVLDILAKIRTGYTRETLIKQLQDVAKSLGRTPRTADVNTLSKEGRCVTAQTFSRYFGSFNLALKAAGFEPTRKWRQGHYTRDILIAQLQELAKELGKVPTQKDLEQLGKGRYATVITFFKYFKSFNEALKAAGLDPNRRRYTHQDLIDYLTGLFHEFGRAPTVREVDERSESGRGPSQVTIRRAFGTFNKALLAVGLPMGRKATRSSYTKQSLIIELQRMGRELNKIPTPADIRRASKQGRCPSDQAYVTHFGSWRNALLAAGFSGRSTRYTKPELILELRKWKEKYGRSPTVPEFWLASKQELVPSVGSFKKHFGSWNNALKAAGLTLNKKRTNTGRE